MGDQRQELVWIKKQVRFLCRQISIINTELLKQIIKHFERGWNYIQQAFIKLILFLVIWSWKYGAMMKNKITILRTSVNRVCGITLSIFPHWISKPCIQKHKNHSKASSSAGRFSQNLRACKNSRYHIRNCKSGRQNKRHTFRRHSSQHKPISTNIPYNGLMVKGKKKDNSKAPSPCRWDWMLCSLHHR